ncbi:MAG: CPBP family intramembrane metalloprotease [Bacillota bacterium]|nr:CPBP family intramembrane metalloprotease [Bacillota bacterium]
MWQDPLTRYALGLSAMFSFYWLCNRFVVSPLYAKNKLSKEYSQLLSTALLYLPSLGILLLFIKDLPASQVSSKGFLAADYVVVFLAQFFAFALMGIISTLEIKLGLVSPQTLKRQNEDNKGIINVLLLTIIVPFLEELTSRKLLGDLLGDSQIGLFLWLSALVFSLIHLQTGRIAVPVGMCYTGFLWAWVYAASGSLLLCTAYHILFNLLMVILPEHLEGKISQKAHGAYYACLALAGITGFAMLAFNFRHFLPPLLSGAGNPLQRIFGNGGFWALAAVCAWSYLYFRGKQALKTKDALPEKS